MGKIVFWGATAQAKMLREALSEDMQLVAVFDNNLEVEKPFEDVPLYYQKGGFEEWYRTMDMDEPIFFAVAIGGKRGRDRVEIAGFLKKHGLQPYNIIHPSVFLAPSVTLGEGVQILPRATLLTNACIGNYTIVGGASVVGHDSVIGDGVHICGGNIIGACTCVDKYATFYTGAMTVPRIKIGEGAVVGIGSIVLKRVRPYTVVYGNPALKIDDVAH